jgi:hypothetical protein
MFTLTSMSDTPRRIALVSILLWCSGAVQATPTGLLNDTGQTQCDNGSNVLAACDASSTGDASAMPRQDGRFGRDVASPVKAGGGAAGFDFSKVCFNGDVQGSGICTGVLVANTTATASGTATTDWACTKDNVTNLIWSLESGYGDWTTYAQTTLPVATNGASRCGFNTGWRLPTQRELLSIVHRGLVAPPMIDANYFPGTVSDWYWTSDTYAPLPSYAWFVDFSHGSRNANYKAFTFYVRLVRSGQ